VNFKVSSLLRFSHSQAEPLAANHLHLLSGGDGSVLGSGVPAFSHQEDDPVGVQGSACFGGGPDQRLRASGDRPGLGANRLGHHEGEKAAGTPGDGEDQVPGDAP